MESESCADEIGGVMLGNGARAYRTVEEARVVRSRLGRRYALRAVLQAIDHGCTTDEIRRACEIIDQET